MPSITRWSMKSIIINTMPTRMPATAPKIKERRNTDSTLIDFNFLTISSFKDSSGSLALSLPYDARKVNAFGIVPARLQVIDREYFASRRFGRDGYHHQTRSASAVDIPARRLCS